MELRNTGSINRKSIYHISNTETICSTNIVHSILQFNKWKKNNTINKKYI